MRHKRKVTLEWVSGPKGILRLKDPSSELPGGHDATGIQFVRVPRFSVPPF